MDIEHTRESRQRDLKVSKAGRSVVDLYRMFFNPMAYVEPAIREYDRTRSEQEVMVCALIDRITTRGSNFDLSNIGNNSIGSPEASLPETIRKLADTLAVILEEPGTRDPILLDLFEDVSSYAIRADDGAVVKNMDPSGEDFVRVPLRMLEGINIVFDGALQTLGDRAYTLH